ncbi:hypothetical protein RB653_002102 [Dictyostelium firmibasis]|uniref:Uncharacterized protein n=1 Tax=Dictyostelium firmibasis TaxID=79012 RepID=A0AAN7TQ11_9MYCE
MENKVIEKEENKGFAKSILGTVKNIKIGYGVDVYQMSTPASLIAPFSSLTYISDSFAKNFELLLKVNSIENELDRLLQVFKYITTIFVINNNASGKPIVPIVGETQRFYFSNRDEDGNEYNGFHCAEQVQNSPFPLSLSSTINEAEGVELVYNYAPKVLFMGTYFKINIDEAETYAKFNKIDETYNIVLPTLYTRIFRGFSEYAGKLKIEPTKSNYYLEANFQSKPLLGGKYNYYEAFVCKKDTNEKIYKIYGQWDKEQEILDFQTYKTEFFFKRPQHFYEKQMPTQLLPTDSSFVWKGLIEAHNSGNNKLKLKEKNKVDEEQKMLEIQRKNDNTDFKPVFFIKNQENNKWELNK